MEVKARLKDNLFFLKKNAPAISFFFLMKPSMPGFLNQNQIMNKGYIIYWRNKQTNFNLIQKGFLRSCLRWSVFHCVWPKHENQTSEIVKEGYLKTPKDCILEANESLHTCWDYVILLVSGALRIKGSKTRTTPTSWFQQNIPWLVPFLFHLSFSATANKSYRIVEIYFPPWKQSRVFGINLQSFQTL